MAKFTITKLDAATRELDGAIHAILNEADPVVVTLLVSAAMVVAENLANAAGFKTFADHAALDFPYSQFKTYRGMAREAFNFLKHAEREGDNRPDVAYTIETRDLEGLACVAIADLQNFRDDTPTEIAFFAWKMSADNVALPLNVVGLIPLLRKLLPGIAKAPRLAQLAAGRDLVEQFNSKHPPAEYDDLACLMSKRTNR